MGVCEDTSAINAAATQLTGTYLFEIKAVILSHLDCRSAPGLEKDEGFGQGGALRIQIRSRSCRTYCYGDKLQILTYFVKWHFLLKMHF